MSEAATETVTQTVTEPSANGSKPAAKTTTTKTTAKPAAPPPPPKILRESAIIPIIMIGAGFYLLWFGVKYWRGAGAATWPSYPLKSVLQGKGIPPNTPAPSPEAELASTEQPTPSGTISGYVNPFSSVRNFDPERIDQGVDASGQGPVRAIGPGIVTYAGQGSETGWDASHGGVDPGGYVSYRLTGGPAAGHEVYFAEGFTPAVTAGQKVSAGEVIGQQSGGIETGWAANPPSTLSQTPQAGSIGGAGPFPTKVGANFDRLLIALGVKAAPNLGEPQSGKLPAGYPDTWNTGEVTTGRPQNIARMFLGQFGWGSGQFAPLNKLWTRESAWRPTARNPSSGALGIAQALGHGTPDTAGTLGNEYGPEYGLSNQQARAANSGNPVQQIRWGLGYIKGVYGSPGAAWRHEQQFGNY